MWLTLGCDLHMWLSGVCIYMCTANPKDQLVMSSADLKDRSIFLINEQILLISSTKEFGQSERSINERTLSMGTTQEFGQSERSIDIFDWWVNFIDKFTTERSTISWVGSFLPRNRAILTRPASVKAMNSQAGWVSFRASFASTSLYSCLCHLLLFCFSSSISSCSFSCSFPNNALPGYTVLSCSTPIFLHTTPLEIHHHQVTPPTLLLSGHSATSCRGAH